MSRKPGSLLLTFLLALAGCAQLQEKIPIFGKPSPRIGGVYRENLSSERLVDLTIVKKLSGEKSLGMFSKYTSYLEGYIRGSVVDYDDNPIQGVIARASDKGKDLPGFDPGVSDDNGIYRIRFSVPIIRKIVDIRGTISYNPPWQQQLDLLGSSLEPQTKETKFRIYFDQESGMTGMSEDIPKTIVRRVTGAAKQAKEEKPEERRTKTAEKKAAPVIQEPAGSQKKGGDFFGGFEDFGK